MISFVWMLVLAEASLHRAAEKAAQYKEAQTKSQSGLVDNHASRMAKAESR
jgi:hypothetical protein